MWESRYGFPLALRLPSGHRRYPEEVVDSIMRVKQRREVGVRLEAAITEVSQYAASPATSVWAELRERHPHLRPHRLRKSTLLALSWALEDECCGRASSPWIFGAFQRERFYRRAENRWRDLSRTARGVWAMADFPENVARPDAPGRGRRCPTAPRCTASGRWCASPRTSPPCSPPGRSPARSGSSTATASSSRSGASSPSRRARPPAPWPTSSTDAGCDTRAVLHDLDRMRAPEPSQRDLRHATDLFNRVVAYVEKVR